MEPPQITIGLLWHSVNSDNLGIGALTVSQIAIVDRIADQLGIKVRYKVFGWRDPALPYIQRDDIDVYPLRTRALLRPGGLYSQVRKCDLVLDISAGDSFADIYGARRFMLNATAKTVVLAARRPLILSPQTIGPYQRWWARLIAGGIMRAAYKIVTRDALSTKVLKPFNFGEKLAEATDVAFRLPYDTPPARSGSKVRFGFNVSGLLFNGGYTKDNMFSLAVDYPKLVHAVVKHFTALPDCEVHLIGHVNSKTHVVEDDHRVAVELAGKYQDVIVAPRFDSPSAAKSYIATMDYFCGSRMHACIAAFSAGVPVLPIAYSRKFAGLFGTLGYNRTADCKTQTAEEILHAVIDGFEGRGELKGEVETGRKAAEVKLATYEDVLLEALKRFQCPSP